MRINREQFKKWLRALRSGKYKQTTGTLQDKDGYCCLGVACKVLIPKSKIEYKYEIDENTGEDIKTEFLEGDLPNEQKYAPKWLKNISEVSITDEYNETETLKEELTDLNDNRGWSFEQIADALEATYPERKKKKPAKMTKKLVKKKK